jgi:hypothetical protein
MTSPAALLRGRPLPSKEGIAETPWRFLHSSIDRAYSQKGKSFVEVNAGAA